MFRLLNPVNRNAKIESKGGIKSVNSDSGNSIIDTNGTIKTLINGVNMLNSKLLFMIIGRLARKDMVDKYNILTK